MALNTQPSVAGLLFRCAPNQPFTQGVISLMHNCSNCKNPTISNKSKIRANRIFPDECSSCHAYYYVKSKYISIKLFLVWAAFIYVEPYLQLDLINDSFYGWGTIISLLFLFVGDSIEKRYNAKHSPLIVVTDDVQKSVMKNFQYGTVIIFLIFMIAYVVPRYY